MSRRNQSKPGAVKEKPAGELIYEFATCGNFPKDIAGLEALAAALERASTDTGITMSAIVRECSGSSAWCPTPHDLRAIATQMKATLRQTKEGNWRAAQERIYGPAHPEWASALLAELIAPTPAEQRAKLHERAIRDMLYYTEGDGQELGDRAFWAHARKHDLRDHAALVEAIRARGGWRTARDLAGALEIPQEQPAKQLEFDGRAAGANDPPF